MRRQLKLIEETSGDIYQFYLESFVDDSQEKVTAMNRKCQQCGAELRERNSKTTGKRMVVAGFVVFPILLWLAYETIMPYLLFLFMEVAGIALIKKQNIHYFCPSCKATEMPENHKAT
jgi:hypothetical protein